MDEQNVSKEAKTIIAILFRDYWATQEQKEKIIKKEKYDEFLAEQEKQKKYSCDDLFNKKEKNLNNDVTENLSLIEVKEHWYSKIWEKILNIFRRKNK